MPWENLLQSFPKVSNIQQMLSLFRALLIFYMATCFSCKSSRELIPFHINSKLENNREAKVTHTNFFSLSGKIYTIDKNNPALTLKTLPGEIISITIDSQINYVVQYPEKITLIEESGRITIIGDNQKNTHLNQVRSLIERFFSGNLRSLDVSSTVLREEVCANKDFIDTLLAPTFRQIDLNIQHFSADKKLNATDRSAVSGYVAARKLALSYYYFKPSIPCLKTNGKFRNRIQKYLNEFQNIPLTPLSNTVLRLLATNISSSIYYKPIDMLANGNEVMAYLNSMDSVVERNTYVYNYITSALLNVAKSKQFEIEVDELQKLRRRNKESQFNKYVSDDYISQFVSGDKKEMNKFFDITGVATNLPTIIEKFKSKPTLIDFWATWCGPCLQEIPRIVKLPDNYQNLNLVFISLDKAESAWAAYIQKNSLLLKFPNFRRNYNNQDSIFSKIKQIPKYGLLTKDGKIELFDALEDSALQIYYKRF